jgi:hypothetical protein
MYCIETSDEWKNICKQDLWCYNKLILASLNGYSCGPAGVPVSISGNYIVRPCMNLLGMSRYARIEYIKDSTDHFHPAEFWCEILTGEHLSVDFYQREPKLIVLGERNSKDPLYKWKKWSKVDRKIEFPQMLNNLVGNYNWINCEFIEKKLIEVHFRRNSDFRYQNKVAYPVWKNEIPLNIKGHEYIDDEDYLRKGFYIK